MKTQLAMVIDSSKCIDCKGCMASCKVQNNVAVGHWRNWIKHSEPDFSQGKATRVHFQPGGCMQCDNPTCVAACPTGATWKDAKDGVVYINQDLCIGCGNCLQACPYGARYRDPKRKVADKCDFCASRRAVGQLPACVDTCPTKARVFGDINDPQSEAAILLKSGKSVRIIAQKTDTKPNMYYLASTLPIDWAGEPVMPTAMQTLTAVVKPVTSLAVGLSALGVAAMFFKQNILGGDKPDDDHHEVKKEAGHGK